MSTFAWSMLDIGKQAKRYTEAVNIIYMLLQKCARTGELSGAHAAFLHVRIALAFASAAKRLTPMALV